MKYTDDSTTATYTRRINITDGPVHGQAYSTTGRQFRAERITIPYALTDAGTWEVYSAWAIDITGVVLRKDGSDSQNTHSRKPDSANRYREPLRFEGEWAWVGELIDAARPEGRVTLPPMIKQAL
jgi:hypothetical protein